MAPELRQIIDEVPVPLDLPWSSELTQKNYPAALAKIDAHMIEHPEDLSARLWWIQCQSEAGTVPATALSAPLEEILPRLRDANELYEGAVAGFLRVACRLIEKKQTKLAVVLLDRAYEFARKGRSLPMEAREHIRLSLLSTLKLEQERAELKHESKSYIESIKKKHAEISELKEERSKEEPAPSDAVPSDGPQFPKKGSRRLSAASVLEAALEERDLPEPAVAPAFSGSSGMPRTDRHTGAAILISLCGGLMIVLGILFERLFVSTPDALDSRLAVNLLPTGFPQLVLPPLEFSVTSAEASLATATKKLEKIRSDDGKPPEPLAWSGGQTGNQSATQNATQTGNQNDTVTAIPAPPVPTERPLSADERRKLPEMNTDTLARAAVQSLGESPERNPVGSVVRGPDGRVYGPPPTDPSARALDGSQLQPVEVDQLPTPKHYRVIVTTAVFSAPSVIAQAVARLEKNAKIQVVARMGKWLELRSAGGRRGYIYAQDAAPAERE